MDVRRFSSLYVFARVITDLKNMADCHEERALKASDKAKTKTGMTATRLVHEIPEKRDKCWKKAQKRGETTKGETNVNYKTNYKLIY